MTSGFTRELALTAGLMVTGAALNAVATWTLLPPRDGADHEAIFTRYADSGAWVAAHLVQFAGILLGLAGLFSSSRATTASSKRSGTDQDFAPSAARKAAQGPIGAPF